MRNLQNYLLILMMDESTDIVKASTNIIRYGNNSELGRYKDITTEEVLRNELIDAIAITMLLNLTGMNIVTDLVINLLKDDSMYIEINYRITNVLKFMRNNLERLQLNRDIFNEFESKAKRLLEDAKLKLEEIEQQ